MRPRNYFRRIPTYVITVPKRHRETDRQTDGRHTISIPRYAHSASSGKKSMSATTATDGSECRSYRHFVHYSLMKALPPYGRRTARPIGLAIGCCYNDVDIMYDFYHKHNAHVHDTRASLAVFPVTVRHTLTAVFITSGFGCLS